MVLPSRQLFLSERVVSETEVSDGGVLVDENGIIEEILTRAQADKLIEDSDGKIKVIDGGSLALLAGVVDSHVHVNEPGRTAWEGFRTATAAAAVGGTTTIVDMPLNSIPPTTTVENLKKKATAAKDNIYVDVGFWGGVIPGNQDALKGLVKAGVVGFKCFLCPSGVEEFPNVNAADLEKAFAALEGTGSLLARKTGYSFGTKQANSFFMASIHLDDFPNVKFHAEMEDDQIKSGINKKQKKDPEEYTTYLESRPPTMELNAITLISKLLENTKVRVHIVHVSSASVVPLLEEARAARRAAGHEAWRAGVTAETCHHYLTFSADEIPRGHSEYKCAPPIRDLDNKEKLWEYLLDNKLDLVVSDHSPCTPDLKTSNNLEAWGGISSVQFGLSLFWTAASSRKLGLPSISKYLSAGPARLCGLDCKGALRPGCDADLVFFDPEATFTVTTESVRHKNKLTPYLGRELRGVVKETYLRGRLIYGNGDITGEPSGTLLLNNY